MNPDFRNIDPEFLRKLEEMRDEDIDAFSDLVYKSLKMDPTFAIDDPAPTQKKIKALNNLLNNFEEREEYERCSFLSDLINQIKDEQ